MGGTTGDSFEGQARFQRPIRNQVEFETRSLDMTVPAKHTARIVWAAIEKLDLSEFYARIKAVEGHVGRPPIDPRILLALWVYATLDGVGSARRIATLCNESDPYRWLCGGVGVNHHALSDFRAERGDEVRQLMIQHVASLRATGLVELKRVTQDGMKVRACAGRSSFRNERRLRELLQEAEQQVRELEREAEEDPAAGRTREEAAKERAAREIQEKVKAALQAVEKVQKRRAKSRAPYGKRLDPSQARASTTDPDAQVMRMADGGTRPAYNAQFATDTTSGLVVDVALAETSADYRELPPMLDAIRDKYGKAPQEMVADLGYLSCRAIEHAAAVGTTLYTPPYGRKRRTKPARSPLMKEFRARMERPEATRVLKERGRWAEWVFALARNRGLYRLVVRGRRKVLNVMALFAIAHNIAIVSSQMS
jgi:transposase